MKRLMISLVVSFFLFGIVQIIAQPDETYVDLQKRLFGDAQNVRLTAKWNIQGKAWDGLLWDSRHTGIDYSAPEGTPVYSATDGFVIRVEYGKDCRELECLSTVAIYNRASEVTFIYLHMKDIKVKLNDEIKAGERIGAVGQRGPATGSHLHFEARPGKQLYASLNVRETINPYEATKKTAQDTFVEEFSIQQHLQKPAPGEKEAQVTSDRFTKVANVSCDELSRLGVAIGQVLQKELNSPEMRRLAVMRALNLADEAINTGNL